MNKFVLGIATLLHLIPHPFGVSPVGAAALYAGANGPARTAFLVPTSILLLGNAIFGFYDLVVMAFVYLGFVLSTFVGRWLLRKKRGRLNFASAIVAGALAFFLLSNFSVWWVGMYPPTMAGLIECYLNGLPYLGQAMLADAAFCFVLFGMHHWLDSTDKALPKIAENNS